MPVKYPSNFWRSLKTPSINCKVELKPKWRKYCVLAATGNDNTNDNPNNIIFSIKEIKLSVSFVTLSAKDNQKSSKHRSERVKRSVYWNEYKTKCENKNTRNEYRYFLESNFVGFNRVFVLLYANQDDNAKNVKTQRYYLPKSIIKNFYDRAVDSDIKQY